MKYNNDIYIAVADLDIGNQDLLQCADALMLLRGEYFFRQKKYDRIYFTAAVSLHQVKQVEEMALKLLKEDGLILYPKQFESGWGALELWKKYKSKLKLIKREEGYAFVPLLRK